MKGISRVYALHKGSMLTSMINPTFNLRTDQRWIHMETVDDVYFKHLHDTTKENIQERVDELLKVGPYDLAALKHLEGSVDIVELLYKRKCQLWEDRIKETSEVIEQYQETHCEAEQIKLPFLNTQAQKYETWKAKHGSNPTKEQIRDFLTGDAFPFVDVSAVPDSVPERNWTHPYHPVVQNGELSSISLCELLVWAQQKLIDMSSFDIKDRVMLMEYIKYGPEGFKHFLSFLNNCLFFDGFAITGIEYDAAEGDGIFPVEAALSFAGYPYKKTGAYEKRDDFVVKRTKNAYYIGWKHYGEVSSVKHGQFNSFLRLPSSSVYQNTVADIVCTTDDTNKAFAYAGIASLALSIYCRGLWHHCKYNRKHPDDIYPDLLAKTASGNIADERFLNAIFASQNRFTSCYKMFNLLGVKSLHLLYYIGMFLTGFCGKDDEEQKRIVACAEKVAALFV